MTRPMSKWNLHIVHESQIDPLVMRTICRIDMPGSIIDNTSERILNAVACSVLLHKPDAVVSPVLSDARSHVLPEQGTKR